MSSLKDDFQVLERDLTSDPMRICVYHDLPFALFRYDPWLEFELRKRVRLLAHSLEANHHKNVTFISLSEILWSVMEQTEGLDAIIAEETQFGYERAQQTIHSLLSEEEFMALPNVLEQRMKNLDPGKDLVFLIRTAALAPAIFRCSVLLDHMHGRTMVPVILFYPGTAESKTGLQFMGIQDRAKLGMYSYRVKIYGGE